MAGAGRVRPSSNCGCRVCLHERPGADWNAHDKQLFSDVETYGWHLVGIRAEDEIPGWSFTVGLWHSFRTPELAIFGLPPGVLTTSLNIIGEAARHGDPLQADTRRDDVLEGYSLELKGVHRGWHRALFGYARWFYPPPKPEFLQCVWPDMSGRFPWQADFDQRVRRNQPELWSPPTQAKKGPWRAWWQSSQWPGRENVNGLVFVAKRAARGETPILGVKVFSDGDWAFLDGGPADPDHMVMLHLHHVLERDASLEELITLEPGMIAWRLAPGEDWSISNHTD